MSNIYGQECLFLTNQPDTISDSSISNLVLIIEGPTLHPCYIFKLLFASLMKVILKLQLCNGQSVINLTTDET